MVRSQCVRDVCVSRVMGITMIGTFVGVLPQSWRARVLLGCFEALHVGGPRHAVERPAGVMLTREVMPARTVGLLAVPMDDRQVLDVEHAAVDRWWALRLWWRVAAG